MANRIKGITVEIGGDTTKLSKALEGVNKNIKNTQTQLKDVQKLLKLDPTNTELLSQKHKLLADAVKATKEKLETLKTAAEQANQALANGDISQEQYDALQREIIETEQELQNLQREAEASSTALAKLGQAGEMLEKAGDKIADVGTTLTTHVTVPVMAAGTAAVKTAADFDSAMSKVAAVSVAAGDELDALRDKAREMGAKTKFSASEAADAMNYMAMAGWKTGDMLEGMRRVRKRMCSCLSSRESSSSSRYTSIWRRRSSLTSARKSCLRSCGRSLKESRLWATSSVCTALHPRSQHIPLMTSNPATRSGWHTGWTRPITAVHTASGNTLRKAAWTASTVMLILISATRISRRLSRQRG